MDEKTLVLPATVYVKREHDGDENYLLAYEEEDNAVSDDGEIISVGVYELKRVKRMRKVAIEV